MDAPLEMNLDDRSRLELRWIHAGLLNLSRWVRGSEFSTAEWLLSGSVLLGGSELERLTSWLKAAERER